MKSAAICALVSGSLLLVEPAAAQDTAEVGLEEIVVTARKREENLQSTPISITALTAADIDARNMSSALDLGQFTPNLVVGPGTVSQDDANFFIRGIGQQDSFSNVEPGVGLYVDGIYLGRTAGAAVDMLDIERVEVLRGPQGTLFGRNTIGGAISIVTAKPGNQLSGKASVRVGQRDRLNAAVRANVPLIEGRLLSSFSAVSKRQDGYVRSSIAGLQNFDEDTRGSRATLRWLPSDFGVIDLVVDGTRRRGTVPCNRNVGVDTNLAWIPDAAANDRSADPYVCFTSQPSIDQSLDAWGTSLTQEWKVSPDLTFKSLSAYRELEQFLPTDQDGTTFNLFDLTIRKQQKQLSQELQLLGSAFDDRLDWVFGAYYFREDTSERQRLTFAIFQSIFGQFSVRSRNFSPLTESYALFGESTFRFNDRFSVTAGLRANWEEKEIDVFNQNIIGANTTTTVDGVQRKKFDAVTPRVGLQYQLLPDVLLYTTYSEGFRSGGFNARAANATQVVPFDPETAEVYEAGFKSEFLNRRLRLNLAAFRTDYTDIQVLSFVEGFATNRNAGDARISGFESELVAQVSPRIRWNAGAGYTDAKYVQLGSAAGALRLNSPLAYAPEWTLSTGLQFEQPLSKWGALRSRLDASYTDKQNLGLAPGFEPSRTIVNARVEWAPRDNLSIAAYALNAFDEVYAVYRQDDRGSPTGAGVANEFIAPPREIGIEAVYRFQE